MRRWQAAVVLSIALIAGLALRAGMVTGRTVYSHDGSISFLAAAGQQSLWHETTHPGSEHYPYGKWARAAHWQEFLNPDPWTNLRMIAGGLAHWDLHPPLYFWLLHYAILTVGVNVWTGALLNTVLDVATILVIFAAARWWLRDSRLAALAALMWAISPAAVETMQEARHYSLFGLAGIAFAWQFIRIIDSRRQVGNFDYTLLAALTCAGALTHYSFTFVAAAALILAWLRSERALLLPLIGSMVTGAVLSLAVNPGVFLILSHGGEAVSALTLPALTERVLKIGYHLFDLWGRTVAGNVILALALLALAIAIAVRHPRGERLGSLTRSIFGPEPNPFLALSLLIYLLIGLAYTGFLMPRHAIGPQYLAPVWPLMAIGAIATLRHLSARRWLLPALLVFALANSAWLVREFRADHRQYRQLVSTVREYDHLLVDQVARGAFLPLVHEMNSETMLYAAHPPDILGRVEQWEPWLLDAPGRRAYVSNVFMDTKPEDRRAILQLLRERGWQVPDEPVPLFPSWVLYPLERD